MKSEMYVSGHRHSRGLDTSYDRLTPDERLQEWSKAINLLTIDESLHLKKNWQVLEGEQEQKLAQQARTIEELKTQLDRVTKKIEDRSRRRMGLFDEKFKPIAAASAEELT